MIEVLFNSQKDIVYSLLVWGSIVFISLLTIFNLSLTILGVLVGVSGSLIVGLILWIWFDTNYRVEEKYIKVSHGPFKDKIAIQSISSISKKKSLLATPSLAMNRLSLRYSRYGEVMVSPKSEKEFIDSLLAKNPQIKIDERIFKGE